ncbi:hypothetical protein T459_14121 [Capsicum annuum]|uniref:3-hydroxyisobutyryl-CoA hydrolase n=1 Tax=Capsicum annuum TaxID=4072 RepID=A0A2G2ZGI0_CAPAN|nr:hypothetical protein T459_14121 [Capsicum annuum]
MLGQKLEKYEKDDNVELVIIKGAGRTFSADGNVKAAVEQKFSLRGPKLKKWCSTPEASLGFHPYCAFSYMLSRLSGRLGEYLGLTGERLRGKDVVAAGLATHFVPSQKLFQLEKCLLSMNNGEEDVIRSVIDEFSTNVQIDERSILNKLPINNECLSRKSVEEIMDSFEVEAGEKGNDWIVPVLKRMKKASPTGLKITLKSIREGRKQTLSECLRREFRITINTLQTIISDDFYEGIRAIIIHKDKSPKWNPSTLDEVHDEQLDLIFKPFEEHDLELQIPVKKDECRHELLTKLYNLRQGRKCVMAYYDEFLQLMLKLDHRGEKVSHDIVCFKVGLNKDISTRMTLQKFDTIDGIFYTALEVDRELKDNSFMAT